MRNAERLDPVLDRSDVQEIVCEFDESPIRGQKIVQLGIKAEPSPRHTSVRMLGVLVGPAAHQPGFKSAGVLEDFRFDFAELAVYDDLLHAESERFVPGLQTLLLNEGQNRLIEFQSGCHAAHIRSSCSYRRQ